MAEQSPPGWYPQPDGVVWYWNGHEYTDKRSAEDHAAALEKRRKGNLWAVVTVAAAVAVIGLVVVVTRQSPEDKASEVCHDYIEGRLKAPATADFSDEHAVENDDVGFQAFGTVDSENGFGAKVRTTYICYVTDSYSVLRASTSDS